MSRKTKSKRLEAPITGAETLEVESGAFESSGLQDSSIPWWREVIREPAALLLSIIVLLRPWRDGVTFPYENAYFVWAIVVAVTIWAIGALRRGDVIRCIRPVSLLTGFLLVSALVGFNSIQYDGTYRNLIWWAGHLGVFILATNALRSRLAVGMVLGAFATASFLEAVFGILHLQYILPFTRLLVNLDSRVLSGAGVDSLSPQLANRLESNRAFGTFLFPNALAAYMILGIPYAIGAAVRNFHRLRLALAATPTRLEPGQLQERRLISVGAGLVAWLAAFVAACLLMYLVLSPYKYYHLQTISGRSFPVSDPASAHLFVWIWWMAVAPLIPAVIVWVVTLRRGWEISWPASCLIGAVALGVSESIALVITFSRGGVLGLLAGVAAGACLLWFGSRRKPAMPVPGKVGSALAAATAFLFIVGAAYLNEPARAESNTPSGGQTTESHVEVQGSEQEVSKALDPTSGRLRLGYWKTG
ncbi:MAG: hypothetical protein HZB26_17340, partial [Candidatus Hydrogenedentes bacterium]|nr:hypothetical protein [Candidatus Hydrogenedentota bacterium]